jgi:hypothetical protein
MSGQTKLVLEWLHGVAGFVVDFEQKLDEIARLVFFGQTGQLLSLRSLGAEFIIEQNVLHIQLVREKFGFELL